MPLDPEEIERRAAASRQAIEETTEAPDTVAGHSLVTNIAKGLAGRRVGASEIGTQAGSLGVVRDELAMLVGFVTDQFEKNDENWRQLYTDVAVNNYLLIKASDIVAIDRRKDVSAPYGEIDYVWVKADARVGRGDNTQSLDGLLTVGGFTRAGDFRGSLSASSSDSGMSGLGPLCTERTPCCCTKRTG